MNINRYRAHEGYPTCTDFRAAEDAATRFLRWALGVSAVFAAVNLVRWWLS